MSLNISLEDYILTKKVYYKTLLKTETESDNCDLSEVSVIKIKAKIEILEELLTYHRQGA